MITLRAPEPSDVDRLYIWENDPEQWLSSLTPVPVSRHRIWDYVNNFDGNLSVWSQLKLMIDCNDVTIGTLDLFDIDMRAGRAFVGIYIDEEYRGRGYGTMALERLATYAGEILGIKNLCAIVAVDNEASQRLFASARFVSSGILREWLNRSKERVDATLFQRLVFCDFSEKKVY